MFLFVSCIILLACKLNFGVNAVSKSYTTETQNAILTYNGKKYYNLQDFHKYITSESQTIQSPYSIQDFYPYELLETDRVHLKDFLDTLPKLETGYYYADKHYYIFKNDAKDFPHIIFEENTFPGGPSDGWYYIAEDFDFVMPNIQKDEIIAFVIYDDSWNEIQRITDKAQIKDITQGILNKTDISPTLNNAGDCWRLYGVYSNCPFSQIIAMQSTEKEFHIV